MELTPIRGVKPRTNINSRYEDSRCTFGSQQLGLRSDSQPPCPRASAGNGRGGSGRPCRRPKLAWNVCRLAMRKTQNELIIMCTSRASTSRRKRPSSASSQDPIDQVADRAVQVSEGAGLDQMLATVDVFDARRGG